MYRKKYKKHQKTPVFFDEIFFWGGGILLSYLEEYRPDVVLCVRDETTFLSADGNGTTGGET